MHQRPPNMPVGVYSAVLNGVALSKTKGGPGKARYTYVKINAILEGGREVVCKAFYKDPQELAQKMALLPEVKQALMSGAQISLQCEHSDQCDDQGQPWENWNLVTQPQVQQQAPPQAQGMVYGPQTTPAQPQPPVQGYVPQTSSQPAPMQQQVQPAPMQTQPGYDGSQQGYAPRIEDGAIPI